MNVFILLAAVFALFAAVDILTAKLLKKKRTVTRNISLAALCVLTVISGAAGISKAFENTDNTTQTLYNAYSYLIEGKIDKAAENAEKVQSPHSDIIALLTYCWRDNYASAFIGADDLNASGELNDALAAQNDKIYSLSRRMTGLDGTPIPDTQAHEQLNTIARDCFALLKVSEREEVEFLSGFKRESMLSGDSFYEIDDQLLADMLKEAPRDKELLRYSVKYYNEASDLDSAERNAKKLLDEDKSIENIVLYTDVIAQKLLNDESITDYDKGDKEIEELIQKAEYAEKTAGNYEEDNPRKEENFAKAEEYRKQANGVKAKRIINWLMAQAPLFGDHSGIIDLQLSKLYTAAGNNEKARAILLDLMRRADKLGGESSVKEGLTKLSAVYYDTSATDEDMAAAISAVLRSDAFLPDSVLSRGYSQFLNNFLKYERVSIFISRVNAENYPTVRAYLNVNGKKDGVEELANDFTVSDFTFADNGFIIPNKNVKRIEDDTNNLISIALVIDGSGSMQGNRIENARRAVLACINNLSPETQELSIVMYDDMAETISPLTNDVSALRRSAESIRASGGTNIPIGLMEGIESLKDAVGTKAIILMTDGEDGNAGEMPNAIEAAQRENIAVFTVSTGGGNREYMENIATQTGGSYMEAVTDTELVNVYTALQNFIVNNYCFEYTVTEDTDSNPRLLTIGLADYEVSSSRVYSYGDLIISKDGSYVTRGDTGSLRLLYAEPSVISAKDAELGVAVFINASGVTDGAAVFVNGAEVKNVNTVGDSVITFVLNGKYNPGALNINVRLKDGTSRSTDRLITVAGTAGAGLAGQTITIGGGNALYADNVEQKDDYTLKLSGNVILNGLIRTDAAVTIQSNAPITSSAGRLTVESGSVTGGVGYIDFSVPRDSAANYGQISYGGDSLKVLNYFSFNFDRNGININNSGVTLRLPGFGDIYADAQFNGSELTYTAGGGYMLMDLQDNLNYTLNNMPLTRNRVSRAVEMITGYSTENQYGSYRGYGISAVTESLTITVRKDFMSVTGTGNISGNFGSIDIADGKLEIDTGNASMFEIKGNVRFNNFPSALGLSGQTPFTIRSAGYYPDSLSIKATGLTIDAAGLSECFVSNTPPKALDGAITINYPISITDEPYKGQVGGWLRDISLACDKIEFICSSDRNQSGIRAYNSQNPGFYADILPGAIAVPIEDISEISLFGSRLGGEISATAVISERQIELNINVDGHLDNSYYGVKHDGRASLNVTLGRNSYAGSTFPVTIVYDGKTLIYNVTAIGNISPHDGFTAYGEDYVQ